MGLEALELVTVFKDTVEFSLVNNQKQRSQKRRWGLVESKVG